MGADRSFRFRTTLSLFWDLSSASTTKRLQSSAALINTLEHFQTLHNEKSNGDEATSEGDASGDESGEEVDASDDDEDENDEDAKESRRLDRQLAKGNSEDLRYAVRRLVRGLASPKESARLGFAVALTEVCLRPSLCVPRAPRFAVSGQATRVVGLNYRILGAVLAHGEVPRLSWQTETYLTRLNQHTHVAGDTCLRMGPSQSFAPGLSHVSERDSKLEITG